MEANVQRSEFSWETVVFIAWNRWFLWEELRDIEKKVISWTSGILSGMNEGLQIHRWSMGMRGVVRPLTQSWIQIICESSAASVPPWYRSELILMLTLHSRPVPKTGLALHLRAQPFLFLRCLMLTNWWTVFRVCIWSILVKYESILTQC